MEKREAGEQEQERFCRLASEALVQLICWLDQHQGHHFEQSSHIEAFARIKELLHSLSQQLERAFCAQDEALADPPEDESDRSDEQVFKFHLGSYGKYTVTQKRQAVFMVQELGFSSKEIARTHNIPQKNIKRWCKNGVSPKKNGGRKTLFPHMEHDLRLWILAYEQERGRKPSNKEIRDKALETVGPQHGFMASRGWVDKFRKRCDQLERRTKKEESRE